MALRDVTLKVGDTLRVILDHNGPVREVELKLSAEGLTMGQTFGAPPAAPAAPKAPTGKQKKPEPVVEAVELEEAPPPPKAKSAPKVAPAKPAPNAPSKPIIDEPVETVEAVDIPMDDLVGGGQQEEPAQEEAAEVRDEASGDLSESDFNLDGDSPPAEEQVEGTDAVVSESDEAPTDDSLIEDAPAEESPEALEADRSMRLTGVPGVSSKRGAPASVSSEEELLDGGGLEEESAEFNQTQAPFDADARTMPPAPRAGSAPRLQAEEPDIEALSLEEEPVSSAPPPKNAPQARPADRPGESNELPAWTGRARDYKDPVIETRKAETRKIQKQGAPAKPAPAFNQEVNMGEEIADEAPSVDIPSEDSDAPAVDIPSDEGTVEAVDIPLDLEEAPAKPVPAAKGKPPAPAPKLPPKPPNKLAKAPTAPIKPPAKPAPVASKPPAAPAKPVPTATKPPAKGAGADGAFTVFLSPPKGADKKQTAAEIIAEINGIDIDAALELAGKMIVPVAKGVSEGEANRVKDKFKEAGLSCRITQKR